MMPPPMGPFQVSNKCEASGPMHQDEYEKDIEKHGRHISSQLITSTPMMPEHMFGFLFRQARYDMGSAVHKNRSGEEITNDLLTCIVRNVAYDRAIAYGKRISIMKFLDESLWENGLPLRCDPDRKVHVDMVLSEIIPTLHDRDLFNSTIKMLGSNLEYT